MPQPSYPLHIISDLQAQMWFRFPQNQPIFARRILNRYPKTGFGIITSLARPKMRMPAGSLIATVSPTGHINPQTFPFTVYELWQGANAPKQEECACRNFFDPESGTWGARGPNAGHHPFCQFQKGSTENYELATLQAQQRIREGRAPQLRPDEWAHMKANAK
jgi:hypothetical protein